MKRVLDLRAQVKAKVKEVEIYEKIAKQHNRGVERVERQKLQAIEQKSTPQSVKAEGAGTGLSGVDIDELTKNSTRLMQVLRESSRDLLLQ